MNKIHRKKEIVLLCRENRRNMNPEESILWSLLRNRKLDNHKFLRQHKVIYDYSERCYHFFILDFYCAEERLAIELDGPIHYFQKEYDDWRTSILNVLNIKVMRIKNEELENIDMVLEKIREHFHRS